MDTVGQQPERLKKNFGINKLSTLSWTRLVTMFGLGTWELLLALAAVLFLVAFVCFVLFVRQAPGLIPLHRWIGSANQKALLISAALTGSVCVTVGLLVYFLTLPNSQTEATITTEPVTSESSEPSQPALELVASEKADAIEPPPLAELDEKTLELRKTIIDFKFAIEPIKGFSDEQKRKAASLFGNGDYYIWSHIDQPTRAAFGVGLVRMRYQGRDESFQFYAGMYYAKLITDVYLEASEESRSKLSPYSVFCVCLAAARLSPEEFEDSVRKFTIDVNNQMANNKAREEGRVIKIERLRLVPVREHYQFDLRITNESLYSPLSVALTFELRDRQGEYVGVDKHHEFDLKPGEKRIARVFIEAPVIGDYVITGQVLNSKEHFVFEIKDDKKNHPVPGDAQREQVQRELEKAAGLD